MLRADRHLFGVGGDAEGERAGCRVEGERVDERVTVMLEVGVCAVPQVHRDCGRNAVRPPQAQVLDAEVDKSVRATLFGYRHVGEERFA